MPHYPRAGAHQKQGPVQPFRGKGGVEGPKEARSLGALPWDDLALKLTAKTIQYVDIYMYIFKMSLSIYSESGFSLNNENKYVPIKVFVFVHV